MNITRLFLFGFLIISFVSVAQTKQNDIDNLRLQFVQKQVKLTKEQDKYFWDLYGEYSFLRKSIHEELAAIGKENQQAATTDDQIKKNLKAYYELKEKELNLDKAYKDKFLALLSPRQLLALYQAENEFVRWLRDKKAEGKQ